MTRATPSTRTSPQHRQRFLAEQGYAYRIVDADEVLSGGCPDVPDA